MATVTGLTADRMLAVEASSIVSGTINGSGHLILTTHGGVQIDAGNALVAVPSSSVIQYLDVHGYTNSSLPATYPVGASLMWMDSASTTASWPPFAGMGGSLRTVHYSTNEATQVWTRLHGAGTTPEQWIRSGNVSNGWSAWNKLALDDNATHILSGNSMTEIALSGAYPAGVSMFSVSTGSGWSLNGGYGTVVTNKVGTDWMEQTFYSNFGGTGLSDVWVRTFHSTNGGGGWTRWRQTTFGILSVQYQSVGTVVPGVNTITVTLPSGKAMLDANYVVHFYVTEQNSGTFGSASYTSIGAMPINSTSFYARFTSSWSSNLVGYISYTLTPVQG